MEAQKRGLEIRNGPAFLYRVALNLAKDSRKKRRPQLGYNPDAHDAVDPGMPPLDRMCEDEAREALRAAIESLPVELRIVFKLARRMELQ